MPKSQCITLSSSPHSLIYCFKSNYITIIILSIITNIHNSLSTIFLINNNNNNIIKIILLLNNNCVLLYRVRISVYSAYYTMYHIQYIVMSYTKNITLPTLLHLIRYLSLLV